MNVLERLLHGPLGSRRSGAVAKERLKLVLEYDRAQLSPGELDLIKDDIIRFVPPNTDTIVIWSPQYFKDLAMHLKFN